MCFLRLQLETLPGLEDVPKTPPFLQELARASVHRALGSSLPRASVPRLPLPQSLRKYLLFPDLDPSAIIQVFTRCSEVIRQQGLVV